MTQKGWPLKRQSHSLHVLGKRLTGYGHRGQGALLVDTTISRPRWAPHTLFCGTGWGVWIALVLQTTSAILSLTTSSILRPGICKTRIIREKVTSRTAIDLESTVQAKFRQATLCWSFEEWLALPCHPLLQSNHLVLLDHHGYVLVTRSKSYQCCQALARYHPTACPHENIDLHPHE